MAVSAPHAARRRMLRAPLSALSLDALIVTDLVNVRYLCGFSGSYGVLVADERSAHLITDGRYAEVAGEMAQGVRVHVQPLAGIDEWFRRFFQRGGWGRVGFEDSMSVAQLGLFRRRMRGSGARLVATEGVVEGLREIKEEGEVRLIARAARLADRLMELAWAEARPGVREADLSRMIRRGAEDLGARRESFENIVASGPNSSRPHHQPGGRRLRVGDPVTIDLGVSLDGYCSDLTRNPVLGRVTKGFERLYDVCLDAQQAALKACRAGRRGCEVDAVAREIIASAGYGDYFNHGLGHGVGMRIHEGPRLNKTSETVLRPGHVVTIEPGIYVPGVGGVRIEDLVVVTDGAPRVLSRSPKELTILPA